MYLYVQYKLNKHHNKTVIYVYGLIVIQSDNNEIEGKYFYEFLCESKKYFLRVL